MKPITREFSFITPAFVHGAYQSQNHGRPELRGPSIRGQLRWWFSALYDGNKKIQSSDEENQLFGGVRGGTRSSLFVARVTEVDTSIQKIAFMPHKSNSAPKNALLRRDQPIV